MNYVSSMTITLVSNIRLLVMPILIYIKHMAVTIWIANIVSIIQRFESNYCQLVHVYINHNFFNVNEHFLVTEYIFTVYLFSM